MKWTDFILCCDECSKKLWDNLKQIEEDWINFISRKKLKADYLMICFVKSVI